MREVDRIELDALRVDVQRQRVEIARLTEERDALLEVVRDAGKQGSGYANRQRAEQIASAMDKAKT